MSDNSSDSYNNANCVKNNINTYIDALKLRVNELESRINITENYYGEVFFTNSQGNSMGQLINDENPSLMIESLVAGREYTYRGWRQDVNTYYNGGTISARTTNRNPIHSDLSGNLPVGSSATLITDQYSNDDVMHCDVFFVIKNEFGKWSYIPIRYNTIRSYAGYS